MDCESSWRRRVWIGGCLPMGLASVVPRSASTSSKYMSSYGLDDRIPSCI